MDSEAAVPVRLCRDCRHFRGDQVSRIFTLGYKNHMFYQFAKCAAVKRHKPDVDLVTGRPEKAEQQYASIARTYDCLPAGTLFEPKS